MRSGKKSFLHSAILALSLAVPAAGVVGFAPTAAVAASTLPAPYVSRALDAVLMPVDASVIETFGLAAGTKGVLVIATDPSGLGAAAGIEPGDVIEFVRGEAIATPVELDEVVYYWIAKGMFDFEMGALRGGAPYKAATTITLEAWETVIDITTVESWSSYSYESFSYSEYYAEYSEEISASYESSETTIEESVTSEEFEADMQTEDEVATDETADEAATDEAATDEAATDEAADAECDPAVDPNCADEAADDGSADEAADDGAADEGGDEGGDEEPVE